MVYQPSKDDKGDIRKILADEVSKYKKKFFISLALLTPILVLMWVVPYVDPEFLVNHAIKKGVTLYILVIFILSTII